MGEANWIDSIKAFKYEDLEGKMLKMHYGYNDGCYCLIGEDVETKEFYVLVNGMNI